MTPIEIYGIIADKYLSVELPDSVQAIHFQSQWKDFKMPKNLRELILPFYEIANRRQLLELDKKGCKILFRASSANFSNLLYWAIWNRDSEMVQLWLGQNPLFKNQLLNLSKKNYNRKTFYSFRWISSSTRCRN